MKSKGKVLFVDDDHSFVRASKAQLEHQGYDVVVADGSQDAWEKLHRDPPDLLILDAMLGDGLKGVSLVYRLIGEPNRREVPILMVTGARRQIPSWYEPEYFWPFIRTYVDKPVRPADLVTWVERSLQPRPLSLIREPMHDAAATP